MRQRYVFLCFAVLLFLGAIEPITALAQDSSQYTENNEEWADYDSMIAAAKASMMGAPQTALEKAQEAETEALTHTPSLRRRDALAVSFWLQAEAQTRLNRPKKSLPLLEKAFDELNDRSSKLAGDLLLSKGRTARVLGEDSLALESFQSAYRVFEKLGEARSQAIALQSIGTLYDSARQYERVIEYYSRASEIYSDDAALDMASLNNRANAYRELGEFEQARVLLDQAFALAQASESDLLQARILTNIAVLETRRGEFEMADAAITDGLDKADSEGARSWAPFLWGVRAELEFARNDILAAQRAIEKTFDGVDISTTPAPFRDFHEIASKTYQQLGYSKLALEHLEAFKRLDDQGRDIAASANLALLNAEFEFANKELEIQKLRTTQLEKDVALARASERQKLIVGVAVLIIALSLIMFFAWALYSAHNNQRVTEALNNELEAKNEELTTTNAELEEANQAKMELMATTSHEIRTPLNAIIGLTDVVLNGDAILERDREYLRIVNRSGKNLLHIVNDILDISKLEAGRLIIEKKPLDIAECILDVAELWRKSAEAKGLAFRVEVDRKAGLFLSDDRLLRQVFSNLLSNAIKFTTDGEVSIHLKLADKAGFSVVVVDTGIGIAPNQHGTIFESFRQADGSSRRAYGGTGLGLAICKKIVTALGGEISLMSELEKGSVFTVSIPAERSEAAQQTETEKSEEPAPPAPSAPDDHADETMEGDLAGVRVLIAEDDAANALVIRAMLEKHVKQVEIVTNGEEALRAAQQGAFDVILMDKQMPIMDGITATKAIRALPSGLRSIPIIAVTADVFTGARELCLKNRMDDFVSKPINTEELLEAIMNATNTQSARYAS